MYGGQYCKPPAPPDEKSGQVPGSAYAFIPQLQECSLVGENDTYIISKKLYEEIAT